MKFLPALLSGLVLASTMLAREPGFREFRAAQESLRYLPPNMRFYELDRLGLTPRSPAPALGESTGLRLVGKWGAGPSVKVTGRDSLVFLSRGSQVAVINYADTANPQVLSYIEVNGLVSRSELVGNRLYIGSTGSDPKYIDVFDVSNPAVPQRLGSLQTRLLDIDVLDTLVYTVAKDSFRVFDFADPANPRQIGACDDTGYTLSVCNGYAYIADRWGLYVVDVRDPTNPHHVASWGTDVISVKARGNICCATTDNQSNPGVLKFTILDVRTPSNPTPLGSLDSCGAYDVFLDGQLAFLSGYYIFNEFRILDISDSTHPHHVGTAATPDQNFGVWENPMNNLAYVADDFGGLIVIDIANLNAPMVHDTLLRAGLTSEVRVQGGYAFVAQEGFGLKVLDVSDPRFPREVGSVDTARGITTQAVVVRDSFAFVGWLTHPWLRVVDVSDPLNPRKAAACDLFNPAEDMVWRDSFLYVAEPYRLQVVDVARPRQPVLVGTCVLQNIGTDLDVEDTLVFVAALPLVIISTAKADSPYIINPGFGVAEGLDVLDTVAYLAHNGLWTASVANPASPYMLDSAFANDFTDDVAVIDSLAVLGGNTVRVYDVADPRGIRLLGSWTPPGWCFRLVYVRPYIYAACYDAGMCVLETTQTGVSERAREFAVVGRAMVVPSVTAGCIRLTLPGNGRLEGLGVYNAVGKEVMRVSNGSDKPASGCAPTVDLTSLPDGVYLLRVKVDGKTMTAKVIKTARR